MFKKIASVSIGAAMLVIGVMPAFATSDTATPEVDISDILTLSVATGASPFGTAGTKFAVTFTNSGANCTRSSANDGSNVSTDFRGYTTNPTGFSVGFSASDSGQLTNGAGSPVSITNVGGGAGLATAAGSFEMATQTTARGYGISVMNVGTDTDYRYDGSTTIADKYHGGVAGATGDNDTNTDFYFLTGSNVKAVEVPDSSAGVTPATGQAFIVDHIVCAAPGEQDLTNSAFDLVVTGLIVDNA
jgi:hypothetical protein